MKDFPKQLRDELTRTVSLDMLHHEAAEHIEKLEAENAQLKAELESTLKWSSLNNDAAVDMGKQCRELAAELAAMRDQEPVGEVYTMEALASGGYVRHHASLTKALPAGTKLYAAPGAKPVKTNANPAQPFAWYDPSADKFTRDRDDPCINRGAVLWPLHRDAGAMP